MSVDFDLVGAFNSSPQQLLDAVQNVLGVERISATTATRPGMFVWTRSLDDDDAELFMAYYDFRPTAVLDFALRGTPADQYEPNNHAMMRAAMVVLRDDPGDALLRHNFEVVLLERLNGALALDTGWDELDNFGLIHDVALPYERRRLDQRFLG